MGKPILYGFPMSPPVRGTVLVAKAIGLDYEFREVNVMAGELKTPEFLKKNPQHTVPILDDDGKSMWDSHAISTYLIDKYAKDDSLYPKDPYKRAVVNQRLHFDSGILFPRFVAISFNLFFKNQPVEPEKVTALGEAYDLMETFLAKDPYLAGNSLTVADLSCITTITTMQSILPIDSANYPKLVAWMERVGKLPYYEEASGQYVETVVKGIQGKIAELSAK